MFDETMFRRRKRKELKASQEKWAKIIAPKEPIPTEKQEPFSFLLSFNIYRGLIGNIRPISLV